MQRPTGPRTPIRYYLPRALTRQAVHVKPILRQYRSRTVEKGQADLIAVGRQSQFNPNIAHHWAHDLGINRKFEDWAPDYGCWLEKRIRTIESFAAPTGAVKR